MKSEHHNPFNHELYYYNSFLEKNGVILLNEDLSDLALLVRIGIVKRPQHVVSIESITEDVLGKNKHFGKGWYRGGAESFYRIIRINLSSGKQKHLAFKAIHSLGSIDLKVKNEAHRMVLLSKINRAPRLYAVSPGTLIKEFLIEDKNKMSRYKLKREAKKMLSELKKIGIKPSFNEMSTIIDASIECGGRLFIIDSGSGDLEGPILNLS